MNQNKDADKQSVGVVEFVVGGWFVIKLEGGVVFVVEKNEGNKKKKKKT